MIFRIYNVVDETGKIIKIGSTIQTLETRSKQPMYKKKDKYKNCKLVLRREFEHEDRTFGDILLKVREQFEISKERLWLDQGGFNAYEPVKNLLEGFGALESARIGGFVGGPIGGKKRWKMYGNLFSKETLSKACFKRNAMYGNPLTKEDCVKGGSIGGKINGPRNVANGTLARARHIHWHVNRNIQKENCKFCFAKETNAAATN